MAAKNLVVAAGLIVFRRLNENIEYLVMKHSRGGHWGTPKGHVDPGETEFETALRETSEEAGLKKEQLRILDNFQSVLHYQAFGKPKKVIFWLSELVDKKAKVTLSYEHSEYKWAALEEAVPLLEFEDMQRTIREAHEFITKSS